MTSARAKLGRTTPRRWRGAAFGMGLALLLAFGRFGTGATQEATPAADAGETARPAEIRVGTCEEAGGDGEDAAETVAVLSDLTPPEGDAAGQPAGVTADRSFTNVPLLLETLLAEDHAIVAFPAADETDRPLACGEIGGVVDETGALQLGLREAAGSGFTGIAYLSPGADGSSTDVSLFLAEGLIGTGTSPGTGTGTPPDADREPAAATEPARVESAATPVADDGDDGDDALDGAAASPVPSEPTAEPEPTPIPTPEPTPTAIPVTVVNVSLTEFAIDLPTTLEAGRTTFDIANDGAVAHSFEIEGDGFGDGLDGRLQSGESASLTVELEPGTFLIYCPVGNHADQGMEIEVTVE